VAPKLATPRLAELPLLVAMVIKTMAPKPLSHRQPRSLVPRVIGYSRAMGLGLTQTQAKLGVVPKLATPRVAELPLAMGIKTMAPKPQSHRQPLGLVPSATGCSRAMGLG
jgi:hypothetical protein